MRSKDHRLDRKHYKFYFIRDTGKQPYSLILLAISKHPSHKSYLYLQSGDRLNYVKLTHERLQEGIRKGVKVTPLNLSNRHLLQAFYMTLV